VKYCSVGTAKTALQNSTIFLGSSCTGAGRESNGDKRTAGQEVKMTRELRAKMTAEQEVKRQANQEGVEKEEAAPVSGDIFVHQSAIDGRGWRCLAQGQLVLFTCRYGFPEIYFSVLSRNEISPKFHFVKKFGELKRNEIFTTFKYIHIYVHICMSLYV
jgi:hypothetical protein